MTVAIGVNLLGFFILVYVHLLFLLPQYFEKKRYWRYGLGLLLLLMLTAAARFYLGWALVAQLEPEFTTLFTPTYMGSLFFGGIFLVLITIPLRLIENWFKRHALEQELKTHQLEAELRFLKAQVNPHFLFNALNNIYSLSFTQSEKAPEMILKLSDMMSYMLYDCKSEQVKLEDEVTYLRNYIDLQQLKKDGELQVDFQVFGDTTGIQVTPMLFIPFFENAFKHGNLEDTEKGWLKSTLQVEDKMLTFELANTFRQKSQKLVKGGVGLENIQARLQLLYPGRHIYTQQSANNIFSIQLQLNLAES